MSDLSLTRFLTRLATLASTLQQLETCLESRATREELYDVAQEWGREAADLLRKREVASRNAGNSGPRSEACPDADWADQQEAR